MESKEQIQTDNQHRLLHIIDLRNRLEELHLQTGPNSSQYINLSLQLDQLEKEYIKELISKIEKEPVGV